MDEKNELTGQQQQVITLLLAGSTQREAADQVGVAPETVSRWKKLDAVFVATLNARQRQMWDAASSHLVGLVGRAVATLEALLDSDNENVRHRAALAILKAYGLDVIGAPDGLTEPDAVERAWESENTWATFTSSLLGP